MQSKKLVIIGTGETGLLAYEYFTKDSDYDVVAFSVNEQFITEKTLQDLPIVALENIEATYPSTKYSLFVAMGSAELNHARARVYTACKNMGYTMASYVSSRCFVWDNVQIGDNCFILEGNILQAFTSVGNNVVMWNGNHLGHRSNIHDHCFISSHVVIPGFCEIGEYSFMGVNSAVADTVKIGKNNFIGIGCNIHKDTQDDSVFLEKPTQQAKISATMFCGIKG